MISLPSEFKNLGTWKKGENVLVFVRQYGRRWVWEFLVYWVELIALGEIAIKPWR